MRLKSNYSGKVINCGVMSYAMCMGLEKGWYPVKESENRVPHWFVHNKKAQVCGVVHSKKSLKQALRVCEQVTREEYIRLCREYNYGI